MAEMSDQEFDQGIAAIKRVQKRMKRLLDEVLQPDVHYGHADIFKRPILKKAGAEEIRRILRWTVRDIDTPEITYTDGHCYAIVHVGCFNAVGTLMASAQAACHSAEPRFVRQDKKGFIYKDPREQLHNIIAMARKRAGVAATIEASGATAFFSDRVHVESAMEAESVPISPWTDQEMNEIRDLAVSRGMVRADIEKLVIDLFGRAKVGTGPEAERLKKAVSEWVKPNPRRAHVTGQDDLSGPPGPSHKPADQSDLHKPPAALTDPNNDDFPY